MRADLDDFALAAHARFPGLPVFALGESMGGAVLLSALATPNPPQVAGAILVSPAVWSRADMPALYRVALFLVAHVTPGIILTNSAASHVVTVIPSDNIEMLRALGRDPLFQKKTRADTLQGLVDLMGEARAAAAHLTSAPPILYLHGSKDMVIPRDAADGAIHDLDGHADLIEYPNGYHMLLRDLEGAESAGRCRHLDIQSRSFFGNLRQQSSALAVTSSGPIAETNMEKKIDAQGKDRAHVSVTSTDNKMAGGDTPASRPKDSNPLLRPGPDGRIPEGQATKSS